MDDLPVAHARTSKHTHLTAREAAYLALLSAMQDKGYISHFLEKWRGLSNPSRPDFHLASEIAYGSCRMALALNHLAEQLTSSGKLSLKLKERTLVQTALYQYYFMDRIPLYALCNETVSIAKRHCHSTFVKFLNALLRKSEHSVLTLPQGDTLRDLGIRYSYPEFFIEKLIKDYGLDRAKHVLQTGNIPSTTQFRVRNPDALAGLPSESFTLSCPDIGVLKDSDVFSRIANDPAFYIQNRTPVELMQYLHQGASIPRKILDLCASPGGKLLLLHDLYPAASLFANDVSCEKLKRLAENVDKYALDVVVSCSEGETLTSDEKFDLIVIDAPCSNTGVLNKRPEARWRLSQKNLEETIDLQMRLIENAVGLSAKGGEIRYLTCSILKDENEGVVERICRHLPLKCRLMKTLLPTLEGGDGGFGCAFIRL